MTAAWASFEYLSRRHVAGIRRLPRPSKFRSLTMRVWNHSTLRVNVTSRVNTEVTGDSAHEASVPNESTHAQYAFCKNMYSPFDVKPLHRSCRVSRGLRNVGWCLNANTGFAMSVGGSASVYSNGPQNSRCEVGPTSGPVMTLEI